jgi:hypothetical protein
MSFAGGPGRLHEFGLALAFRTSARRALVARQWPHAAGARCRAITRTSRTPVVLALNDDSIVFDRHTIFGDDARRTPFLVHLEENEVRR